MPAVGSSQQAPSRPGPPMDKDERQLRALGYKVLEPVACGNAGQSREGVYPNTEHACLCPASPLPLLHGSRPLSIGRDEGPAAGIAL